MATSKTAPINHAYSVPAINPSVNSNTSNGSWASNVAIRNLPVKPAPAQILSQRASLPSLKSDLERLRKLKEEILHGSYPNYIATPRPDALEKLSLVHTPPVNGPPLPRNISPYPRKTSAPLNTRFSAPITISPEQVTARSLEVASPDLKFIPAPQLPAQLPYFQPNSTISDLNSDVVKLANANSVNGSESTLPSIVPSNENSSASSSTSSTLIFEKKQLPSLPSLSISIANLKAGDTSDSHASDSTRSADSGPMNGVHKLPARPNPGAPLGGVPIPVPAVSRDVVQLAAPAQPANTSAINPVPEPILLKRTEVQAIQKQKEQQLSKAKVVANTPIIHSDAKLADGTTSTAPPPDNDVASRHPQPPRHHDVYIPEPSPTRTPSLPQNTDTSRSGPPRENLVSKATEHDVYIPPDSPVNRQQSQDSKRYPPRVYGERPSNRLETYQTSNVDRSGEASLEAPNIPKNGEGKTAAEAVRSVNHQYRTPRSPSPRRPDSRSLQPAPKRGPPPPPRLPLEARLPGARPGNESASHSMLPHQQVSLTSRMSGDRPSSRSDERSTESYRPAPQGIYGLHDTIMEERVPERSAYRDNRYPSPQLRSASLQTPVYRRPASPRRVASPEPVPRRNSDYHVLPSNTYIQTPRYDDRQWSRGDSRDSPGYTSPTRTAWPEDDRRPISRISEYEYARERVQSGEYEPGRRSSHLDEYDPRDERSYTSLPVDRLPNDHWSSTTANADYYRTQDPKPNYGAAVPYDPRTYTRYAPEQAVSAPRVRPRSPSPLPVSQTTRGPGSFTNFTSSRPLIPESDVARAAKRARLEQNKLGTQKQPPPPISPPLQYTGNAYPAPRDTYDGRRDQDRDLRRVPPSPPRATYSTILLPRARTPPPSSYYPALPNSPRYSTAGIGGTWNRETSSRRPQSPQRYTAVR